MTIAPKMKSNNLSFVDLVKKLSKTAKMKHNAKSTLFVKNMVAIFLIKID